MASYSLLVVLSLFVVISTIVDAAPAATLLSVVTNRISLAYDATLNAYSSSSIVGYKICGVAEAETDCSNIDPGNALTIGAGGTFKFSTASISGSIGDKIKWCLADGVQNTLATDFTLQTTPLTEIYDAPSASQITSINSRVATAAATSLTLNGLFRFQLVGFVAVGATDCSGLTVQVSANADNTLSINNAVFSTAGKFAVCVGEPGAPASTFTLQDSLVITVASSPVATQVTAWPNPRLQYNYAATLAATGLLKNQKVMFVSGSCRGGDVSKAYEAAADDVLILPASVPLMNNYTICLGEYGALAQAYTALQIDGKTLYFTVANSPLPTMITSASPRAAVGAAATVVKVKGAKKGQLVTFISSAGTCSSLVNTASATPVNEDDVVEFSDPMMGNSLTICLGEYMAAAAEYVKQSSVAINLFVTPNDNQVTSLTPRFQNNAQVNLTATGLIVGQVVGFVPATDTDCSTADIVNLVYEVTTANSIPIAAAWNINLAAKLCVKELGGPYTLQTSVATESVGQPGVVMTALSPRIMYSSAASVVATGVVAGQIAIFVPKPNYSTGCANVNTTTGLTTTDGFIPVTSSVFTTYEGEPSYFVCLGEFGATASQFQRQEDLYISVYPSPSSNSITYVRPRFHTIVAIPEFELTGAKKGQLVTAVLPTATNCLGGLIATAVLIQQDDFVSIAYQRFEDTGTFRLCLGELGAGLSSYTLLPATISSTAANDPPSTLVTKITPRVHTAVATNLTLTGVLYGQMVVFTRTPVPEPPPVPQSIITPSFEVQATVDCSANDAIFVKEDNVVEIPDDYPAFAAPAGDIHVCIGEFGSPKSDYIVQDNTLIIAANDPAVTQITQINLRVQTQSATDLDVAGVLVGQLASFVLQGEPCSAINTTLTITAQQANVISLSTETFVAPGKYELCIGEFGSNPADHKKQTGILITAADSPSTSHVTAMTPRVQRATATVLYATGLIEGQFVVFVPSTDSNCGGANLANRIYISTNDAIDILAAEFPAASDKNLCVGELGATASQYTLQQLVNITAANSPSATQLTYINPRVGVERDADLPVKDIKIGQLVVIVPPGTTDCNSIVVDDYARTVTVAGMIPVRSTDFLTPTAGYLVCLGEYAALSNQYTLQTAAAVKITAYQQLLSDITFSYQVHQIQSRVAVSANATIEADSLYIGQMVGFVDAADNNCNNLDKNNAALVIEYSKLNVRVGMLPQPKKYRVCVGELGFEGSDYTLQDYTGVIIQAYGSPAPNQITFMSPRVFSGRSAAITVAGLLKYQSVAFVNSSAVDCSGINPELYSQYFVDEGMVGITSDTFSGNSTGNKICVGEAGALPSAFTLQTAVSILATTVVEYKQGSVSARIAQHSTATLSIPGVVPGQVVSFVQPGSIRALEIDETPLEAYCQFGDFVTVTNADQVTIDRNAGVLSNKGEYTVCIGELGSERDRKYEIIVNGLEEYSEYVIAANSITVVDVTPPNMQQVHLSPRVAAGRAARINTEPALKGQVVGFVPKDSGSCASLTTSTMFVVEEDNYVQVPETLFTQVGHEYWLCLGELGTPAELFSIQRRVDTTAPMVMKVVGTPTPNQLTSVWPRVTYISAVDLDAPGIFAGQLVLFVNSTQECSAGDVATAVVATTDSSFITSVSMFAQNGTMKVCLGELGAPASSYVEQTDLRVEAISEENRSDIQLTHISPRVAYGTEAVLVATGLLHGQRVGFVPHGDSCASDHIRFINITTVNQISIPSGYWETPGLYDVCLGEVGSYAATKQIDMTVDVISSAPATGLITYASPRVLTATQTTIKLTGALAGQQVVFVKQAHTSCAFIDVSKALTVMSNGYVPVLATTFPTNYNGWRVCVGELGASAGSFTLYKTAVISAPVPTSSQVTTLSPRFFINVEVDLSAENLYTGQFIYLVSESCAEVVPANATEITSDNTVTLSAGSFTSAAMYKLCVGELGSSSNEYTLQYPSVGAYEQPASGQITFVSPRIFKSSAATLVLQGAIYGQQVAFLGPSNTDCSDYAGMYDVDYFGNVAIPASQFNTAGRGYKLCLGELGAPIANFTLQNTTVVNTNTIVFDVIADAPTSTLVTSLSPRVAVDFDSGLEGTVVLTSNGTIAGQKVHFVQSLDTDCSGINVTTALTVMANNTIPLPVNYFMINTFSNKLCVGELGAPASKFTLQKSVYINSTAENPTAQLVSNLSVRVAAGYNATLIATGVLPGHRVAFIHPLADCSSVSILANTTLTVTVRNRISIPSTLFSSQGSWQLCVGELGASSTTFAKQAGTLNVVTTVPVTNELSTIDQRVSASAAVALSVPGLISGQVVGFVSSSAFDCSSQFLDATKLVTVANNDVIPLPNNIFTTQLTQTKLCVGELGLPVLSFRLYPTVNISSYLSPKADQIKYIDPRTAIFTSTTLNVTGALVGQFVGFVSSANANCSTIDASKSIRVTTNDLLTISDSTFPLAGKYQVCLGEYGAPAKSYTLQSVAITVYSLPFPGQVTTRTVTDITPRVFVGSAVAIKATGVRVGQIVAVVQNTDCSLINTENTLLVTADDSVTLKANTLPLPGSGNRVCVGEYGATTDFYALQINDGIDIVAATSPANNQLTSVSPTRFVSNVNYDMVLGGALRGQMVSFTTTGNCADAKARTDIFKASNGATSANTQLAAGNYTVCLGEYGNNNPAFDVKQLTPSFKIVDPPTAVTITSISPAVMAIVNGKPYTFSLSGVTAGQLLAFAANKTCSGLKDSDVITLSTTGQATVSVTFNYATLPSALYLCLGEYGMSASQFVLQTTPTIIAPLSASSSLAPNLVMLLVTALVCFFIRLL